MARLSQALCANCHAVPEPKVIAREFWPKLFGEMKGYMERQSMPFDGAALKELEAHYVAESPVGMKALRDDYTPGGLPFRKEIAGWPKESERPMITHVRATDLDQDGRADAVICENFDGRPGRVSWLRHRQGRWEERLLAFIEAPVRSFVFDHDGDGDLDLVIASMGIMEPNEQLIGSVIVLVNDGKMNFSPRVIAKGLARVTDVKPMDVDGDGDLDFLVAMFGWRFTGKLGWLETKADGTHELHTLLEANGAMRLAPVSLNGDGRPDFLCLFSQQHETMMAFTNEGGGQFSSRILDRAPTPSWGSSGFVPEDLDGDGDLDILLTNGDVMDTDGQPKPYHGIRWLENVGGFLGWMPHDILSYHNCYQALPIDLDGDGDLDIVASNLYYHWDVHEMPSLIWLENQGGMRFTPRRLAYTPTNLASFDIADFDGDGTLDILGGGMHLAGPLGRDARLTAWMGGAGTTDDRDQPRPVPGTELNKILLVPPGGEPPR